MLGTYLASTSRAGAHLWAESPPTLAGGVVSVQNVRSAWEGPLLTMFLCPQVIYMARNPKDLVVSYYQFHRSLRTMSYRGTFQEFCRRFMNDKRTCPHRGAVPGVGHPGGCQCSQLPGNLRWPVSRWWWSCRVGRWLPAEMPGLRRGSGSWDSRALLLTTLLALPGAPVQNPFFLRGNQMGGNRNSKPRGYSVPAAGHGPWRRLQLDVTFMWPSAGPQGQAGDGVGPVVGQCPVWKAGVPREQVCRARGVGL